ncbi:hypothetical protein V5O48_012472 [Marasmius crinis-equi]|uniref:Major facilitator superfamily (MFS) profile domain-containing protein n=1 Tax=Marasmius crinis-equi TaxID=585013 RepID=A0ABR3F2Z4_9AGAR
MPALDEKYGKFSRDEKDDLKHAQVTVENRVVPDIQDDSEGASLEYPDGGLRAWLVVLGAVCNHFSTFGYGTSWGTFQAYYQDHILQDSTPSAIAWIGSIQFSLCFITGMLYGRLFDKGYYRSMLTISSLLVIVATFLVAECKVYWQFVLCQGVAIGLGNGGIYSVNVPIIAHWFERRRGLAIGLVTAGAAAGGVFFPIVIRVMLPRVGFQWCMRIIGFILLAMLGLGNLLLKTRLPPSKIRLRERSLRQIFLSSAYNVYCICGFTAFLGIYTALTFFNSIAVSYGIDPNFAIYLTSIVNGVSGVSRLLCGIFVDRWGALNVMIPFTLISAISTYAWPFARDEASLVTVAVIYGFATGAFISAIVNPIFKMGASEDFGLRVGLANTFIGAGALVGPPISGAIQKSSGGYNAVGYYAGSVVLLATIQMVITRQLLLGRAVVRGKI